MGHTLELSLGGFLICAVRKPKGAQVDSAELLETREPLVDVLFEHGLFVVEARAHRHLLGPAAREHERHRRVTLDDRVLEYPARVAAF